MHRPQLLQAGEVLPGAEKGQDQSQGEQSSLEHWKARVGSSQPRGLTIFFFFPKTFCSWWTWLEARPLAHCKAHPHQLLPAAKWELPPKSRPSHVLITKSACAGGSRCQVIRITDASLSKSHLLYGLRGQPFRFSCASLTCGMSAYRKRLRHVPPLSAASARSF